MNGMCDTDKMSATLMDRRDIGERWRHAERAADDNPRLVADALATATNNEWGTDLSMEDALSFLESKSDNAILRLIQGPPDIDEALAE